MADARQVGLRQQPRPRRIVDVVVHVGHQVGDPGDLPFERCRALVGRRADGRAALALRVLRDAVAHFPREVQAAAVVLEHVDDAQALLVVVEAARREIVQHALAGVTERRVSEVVTESDRLGELLLQAQHLGDRPRDLRHLQRVRESRAVVIARGREEHLRLVLQPAERLAVHDAIAIALERRPDRVFGLGAQPAARGGAQRRLRGENLTLALLRAVRESWTPSAPQDARSSRKNARAGRECRHRERVGERLPQVGERGPGAEVGPGTHRAAVDQQRHVLARVIRARRGRIVPVVGGDHQQVGRSQRREQLGEPARRIAPGSRRIRRHRCGGRTGHRSPRGWRRSIPTAYRRSPHPPRPSPHRRSAVWTRV